MYIADDTEHTPDFRSENPKLEGRSAMSSNIFAFMSTFEFSFCHQIFGPFTKIDL